MRQYCASDAWKGDLATGRFELNTLSCHILGLAGDHPHGLLTLIRCFERGDHARLIDLFEQAAADEMQFSFATTVAHDGKAGQPVFCIGRSTGPGSRGEADLSGVFIFPHL